MDNVGPSLALYVDGVCQPNPGKGACGCVCFHLGKKHGGAEAERVGEFFFEGCLPLCDKLSTGNTAEYMGLIYGLRRTLRELQAIPASQVSLVVLANSQVVNRHMSGEVGVRSKGLLHYNKIALGLVRKFKNVQFKLISKEQNVLADAAARKALTNEYRMNKLLYSRYYPNLVYAWNVFNVRLSATVSAQADNYPDALKTVATNNVGGYSPDGHSFIDARYLMKLEDGKVAVENLKDPAPFAICFARISSNILGVLSSPLYCEVELNPPEKTNLVLNNLIVVDNFPVPLHISRAAFAEKPGLIDTKVKMGKESLNEHYQKHPYWGDDVPHILGFDF